MLSTRHRDSLGPLALMLAIVTCVLLLYSRLAHAAVGLADPTPALTSGAGAGWDAFAANGPLWGGILVAFIALQTFLSRQHWLAQGRLLATLTGIAMIGAAVVNWHFAGAPSAGIMTAVVAAAALVWHPTVPGAKPGDPTRGAGTLAILALVLAACAAGSTPRQVTSAGVVAALDCEAAHLDAQALADAKAFASAMVQHWISGGTAPSADTIKADLAPIKSDLGRCAITGALAAATALVAPPAPPAGTVVSALVAGPDPIRTRAAFSVSARLLGWAPIKVAGGEVL
jgi:hypothetical protein